MTLVAWTGTNEQLLWFDGLTRTMKNHVLAARSSGLYELMWNPDELCGQLVKVGTPPT